MDQRIRDAVKQERPDSTGKQQPRRIPVSVILFILIVFIAGIQTWSIYKNTRCVARITSDLGVLKENELNREKSRQEVIGLRIKNESQREFWGSLFSSFGPLATTLVALTGAFLGFRNYLDTRKKEQVDRAAGDLKDLLTHTADENPRLRIVGVVGLQHFFMPDKKEYHLQALSSLVAMARMEEDDEVLRNIKIAVEKAARNLSHDVLAQVSWQDVTLKEVNFSGCDLTGLDFRDAVLEDADFSYAILRHTRFDNTRLNGACFDCADLGSSNLTYADLAGASLKQAKLNKAVITQTKVLRMNIQNADLRHAVFNLDKMPWSLIKGWRNAEFDDGIRENLIKIHGPAPSGIHVLMLLWEIPPLVAGGTWTAAYHLVRNLRKRGVQLTVVVPWEESMIQPNPFNCGVEVVPLGINLPTVDASPYGQIHSPYGSPTWGSPYSWSNAYGSGFSPYGYSQVQSPYSTISVPGDLRKGAGILRLTEEFKRRFVTFCRHVDFDVIHAHDWVTFGAAQAASENRNKPWTAHFHSTEFERRSSANDMILARIEQKGGEHADHVVTPSRTTADVINTRYGIAREKITVMPNPLSDDDISPLDMGYFESRIVTFTGRLTEQKRPDLFIRITERLASMKQGCRFTVYGTGELRSLFPYYYSNYDVKGPLSWENRGEAYRNASAVLITSQAEPFGMVILEAMQHHVPVFYPSNSGAAEVLNSGFKIDPHDTGTVAGILTNLLENWELWENTVEQQMDSIRDHMAQKYELILTELWDRVHKKDP